MTKPNYTDITIILDRSASMTKVWSETIDGVHAFIKDQRAIPGEATISLAVFNHDIERVISADDIRNNIVIDHLKVYPRGTTNLYNAIGTIINETGNRLRAMYEHDRPSKVIVLIVTDGEHNQNFGISKERVREMIGVQSNQYNWQFAFIGANQDAVLSGADIGISADKSLTYDHSNAGTKMMFAAVSNNTGLYRGNVKHSYTFEASEVKAQQDLINNH